MKDFSSQSNMEWRRANYPGKAYARKHKQIYTVAQHTFEEALPLALPLTEPEWTLLFDLNNKVKFLIVAETAIALIRQTAGVATRIKRTITPAKYMLVKPYITINMVASDNILK